PDPARLHDVGQPRLRDPRHARGADAGAVAAGTADAGPGGGAIPAPPRRVCGRPPFPRNPELHPMHELLATVAHWLNAILPDAFQLPSLSFELPHGVYWLGLILFPFIAMYLVRRSEERGPPITPEARINTAVAWMMWVGG